MTDNARRLRGATRPCPFCTARCLDVSALFEHMAHEHRAMFPSMDEFFEAVLPRIRGKTNAEVNAIMAEVAQAQNIEVISRATFEERADPARMAVQRTVDATPRH